MAVCVHCQGVGHVPGDYPACPSCNGRGDNGMDRRIPCQTCGGSGRASTRRNDTCCYCGGSGRVADPPKPEGRGPGKGTRSRKPGDKDKDKNGALDGIGKLLAAAAALAAGVWAHRTMPDAPAAWFIVAAIAGALTYALRAVIIVGGAILAALALFFGEKDDADPVDGVSTASADPLLPEPAGTTVQGFCLANLTGSEVALSVTAERRARSDEMMMLKDETRVFWRLAESGGDRAFVTIRGNRHELAASDFVTQVSAGNVTASDLPCGSGGLIRYELRHDGSGYRITSS